MTKSQLERRIDEEKRTVERMRENLSTSQRLVDRLERILLDLSSRFDRLDDELQPFYKTMVSAISDANSTFSVVLMEV